MLLVRRHRCVALLLQLSSSGAMHCFLTRFSSCTLSYCQPQKRNAASFTTPHAAHFFSFLFFWLSFSLLRAHALHGVGVSVNNSHCHVLICIARQISPSFTVCSTCKYALCGSEFRCHIIYIFFKFTNVMSHHWIVPAWLSCVWHSHCSVSNGRLRCLLQASFLVGTQPST